MHVCQQKKPPEQADTSSEDADPPGQDSSDSYTDLSEASGVEDSDFVFSHTGQTVAVFYDDDFHIGNVNCN